MKTSVYIESSVISYLTARPSRDIVKSARQAITEEWWQKDRKRFEVFISALVEEEISEIKELLFKFDTVNAEVFSKQITQIKERNAVLEIKRAGVTKYYS